MKEANKGGKNPEIDQTCIVAPKKLKSSGGRDVSGVVDDIGPSSAFGMAYHWRTALKTCALFASPPQQGRLCESLFLDSHFLIGH